MIVIHKHVLALAQAVNAALTAQLSVMQAADIS
jgi:hypothetical protein